MTTTHPPSRNENPLLLHGGQVWNRLHSEREELCSALLHDVRPLSDSNVNWEITSPNLKTLERKNRNCLEARLRQIDDALDRLIAGSYGDCNKCGGWIEDINLAADPTLAFCSQCQPRPTITANSNYSSRDLNCARFCLDPKKGAGNGDHEYN